MNPSFSVDRPPRPTQPVHTGPPSQESDVPPQEAQRRIDRPDSPRPDSPSDWISTTGDSSIRGPLRVTNPDISARTLKPKEIELIKAVREGKAGRVRTLLSKGKTDINPDIRDSNGRTLLQEAMSHSHFQAFKALVENGANIHLADNRGDTALLTAAKKRALNETNLLLERGADPNRSDTEESTPLMISSEKGHEEIVQKILSHGPAHNLDANLKRQRDGINAVMLAATNGHTKVFSRLQGYGVDLSLTNNNGSNLLMMSAQHGHIDIVEDLLEKGMDPNQKNNMGRTPILFSAQNGHARTVQKLLEHGAEPDIQDVDGFTPVIKASVQGHSQIVHDLLENRANPNLRDLGGNTALMLTIKTDKTDHEKIAAVLLDHGANVHIQDNNGIHATMVSAGNSSSDLLLKLISRKPDLNTKSLLGGITAIIYAASKGRTNNIETLIKNGADVHLLSSEGFTALMPPSYAGEIETVRMLLKKGIHPDIQNVYGVTAIMSSTLLGQTDATRMLLRHGANPDLQERHGHTALIIAVGKGHTDTAQVLLEHNANINIANEDGMTALAYAAIDDRPDAVEMLLRRGANPSIANNDGLTPLTLASVAGNHETTKILLQHYARYHSTEEEPIVSDDSSSQQESNAVKVQCFDALRLASKQIANYDLRLDYLTQAALLISKLRSQDSYIAGQAINILSEDASKARTLEEKNQILQKQKDVSAQLSRLNRSASNVTSEISIPTNERRRQLPRNQAQAAAIGLKDKIASEFKGFFEKFKNLVPQQRIAPAPGEFARSIGDAKTSGAPLATSVSRLSLVNPAPMMDEDQVAAEEALMRRTGEAAQRSRRDDSQRSISSLSAAPDPAPSTDEDDDLYGVSDEESRPAPSSSRLQRKPGYRDLSQAQA